ncbi:MAG: AAA family ATPase [Planctomycetes bacterium]|nr:AAA family ATPase [Planctomycetota bacterium]
MKPRISSLTVEGYRCLRKLKIEGLGRVNLITGGNNSGKTSVLDALLLLASNGSSGLYNNIRQILNNREEDGGNVKEFEQLSDDELFSKVSGLFTGYPGLTYNLTPIRISARGSETERELKLAVKLMRGNEIDPGVPGIEFMIENEYTTVPVNGILRQPVGDRGPAFIQLSDGPPGFKCIYIPPGGFSRTGLLGALWDNIQIQGDDSLVIDALKSIAHDISRVFFITDDKRGRIAFVKSDRYIKAVPLKSFGDGLNRLFGIALSLVNAKGGFLLIDEFENGLHYSVQYDIWRMIFETAKRLNVQVFATTHSLDAVESFQQAACECPEEGALVKLLRRGEDVYATTFNEQELLIATRDKIEMR